MEVEKAPRTEKTNLFHEIVGLKLEGLLNRWQHWRLLSAQQVVFVPTRRPRTKTGAKVKTDKRTSRKLRGAWRRKKLSHYKKNKGEKKMLGKTWKIEAHVSRGSPHNLSMRSVLASALNRKLAVGSIAIERQRTCLCHAADVSYFRLNRPQQATSKLLCHASCLQGNSTRIRGDRTGYFVYCCLSIPACFIEVLYFAASSPPLSQQ